MSTAPSNFPELMSAEEFLRLESEQPMELVRGRIVTMSRPGFRHGRICIRIAILLQRHLDQNDAGTIVGNDAGVITERKPDTVRGPDVAFYSYERMPKGEDPAGYPEQSPELVFEVKSPDDRWKALQKKVGEFLDSNVLLVCILDPDTRTAHVYTPDDPVRVYGADESITFAPVLSEWTVPVKQFFEAS
ncbi:MAG: Uma2 family endonuclease [Phycisphaeraceae bacterium]